MQSGIPFGQLELASGHGCLDKAQQFDKVRVLFELLQADGSGFGGAHNQQVVFRVLAGKSDVIEPRMNDRSAR